MCGKEAVNLAPKTLAGVRANGSLEVGIDGGLLSIGLCLSILGSNSPRSIYRSLLSDLRVARSD